MWLRTSPARPRAVLNRLDCLRHRSSLDFGFKQRRWTEEEDKKLLELYEQAVREKKTPWPGFIANELGDRSFTAVKNRVYVHLRGAGQYKAYRRWSQDEDSTIREKLQQGVSIVDLPKFLPDRGLNAIKYRVQHLRTVTGTAREIRVRRQEDFTEDQIQRAIHMRLREQKSRSELAAEFNCSYSDINRLWQYRCAPLLSKNDLDLLRSRKYWTAQEVNRLTELYTSITLGISDVALQFPSRKRYAVASMIEHLQLSLARKQRQAALKNEASNSTPVATPVAHQKSRQTLGGFEQRRMFSSSSYALWKHWRADEDAKLLELERQGLKPMEIAKMLEGRSLEAIRHRRTQLKAGISAGKTKYNKPWTSEEDATILEKLRQGLRFQEIPQYVPGRRLDSIVTRARLIRLGEATGMKSGKSWHITNADVQLMIDMRLNQRKTLPEVAIQLGRTYPCVQNAWSYRCVPLLSEEEVRSIHASSKNWWTAKELEHLMELYNRGNLAQKDMALHFPSRSKSGVLKMIHQMKSRNEEEMYKPSEPKHASSRRSRQHSSTRGLQPTRPTLSMPDSIEKTSRREFSLSSRASLKAKDYDWTHDQDQKLLELERQGFPVSRIASLLNVSVTRAQVARRLRRLKNSRQSVTSKRQKWSAEEDAILIRGRQEGLRFQDIVAQLPGRSFDGTVARWTSHLMPRTRDSRQVEPLPSGIRRKWTAAELQRLIELRVHEHRHLKDIAIDMDRSYKAVRKAWAERCVPVLPSETVQNVWSQKYWSDSEEERFIQLHDQGLSLNDITIQFPSRSGNSVAMKVVQLRHRLAVPSRRGSAVLTKFDRIALKTALEPYLDKKYTRLARIYTAFPQYSKTDVVGTLRSMRQKRKKETETEQSDDDSVRVKDA
jgi:hypothetical protein